MTVFGVERASLLASLDTALEYAALVRPDDANQAEMFFWMRILYRNRRMQKHPPMQFAARLRLEKKETLGLYVSGYPTQEYESFIQELQIPTLSEAVQSQSKSIRSIVFIVEVKVIRTKSNAKYGLFLTICDKEEEWEAVVFPDTYAQFRSVVQEDSTLLLEGAMSVRNGRKQWVVSGIYPLERIEEYEAEQNKRLYIKLPSQYDKGLFAKKSRKLYCIIRDLPKYLFTMKKKNIKMVQLSRPFFLYILMKSV
ncbi:hypothetical protein GCM10020331_032140 [Ectobacillus funiculus]